MKILWVNTNFMHPTNKGGSLRTLGMLSHLNQWHEIHYVAQENPDHPEGPLRSREYCTRSYPFRNRVVNKNSVAFAGQLAAGLFASMPLAVGRFHSDELGRFIEKLIAEERFDRAVVDHLVPASYFPDLEHALLFQHNVETVLWRRHVEHAPDPFRKFYFKLQADRMYEFERKVCRTAGHVAAVSPVDAEAMRSLFGIDRVSEVPTGVNIEYFCPPPSSPQVADLVFVGSMDWIPNVDGVVYFVKEVLPLIRRRKPDCTFAIVGRIPPPTISDLAKQDSKILVTGTVPDIRPYLWGSAVSVVPLRIGGGTRLKIYEAMAARTAVVSTTIGAEGLHVDHPENIRLADTPKDFAGHCLDLMEDEAARRRVAEAGWQMVASKYSWEQVSRSFERILEQSPALN
jgi:polysaccharide biosynthesis protein PslH